MIANELIQLVNKNVDEPTVQGFLERNPAAICGAEYVMANAVISKLRLGADYIPDFAYVNPQSGRTFLRLIEIEAPAKQIFTGGDNFSASFNHAYQQVEDWLGWCGRHHNELFELLLPLKEEAGDHVMSYVPRGLLLYGRRDEINTVKRRERWKQKVSSNPYIQVRTYDGYATDMTHFIPPANTTPLSYLKCVTYSDRRFKVKACF